MRWLQSWLRTTADSSGPRCTDGTLLREMPFTAKTCDERAYNNLTEIIPGCEFESVPQSSVPEPIPISIGKNYRIRLLYTITNIYR